MPDPSPKRPGRKPSGTALSNAERQRRYIARLKVGKAVNNEKQDEALEQELREARLQLETQHAIIGTLEHQVEAATTKAASQADAYRRELKALEARLKAVSDELSQSQEREAAAHRERRLLVHERDQARAAQKAVSDDRSARDRRILELHEQGLRGRPLARALDMSESTVRGILKRLGAE